METEQDKNKTMAELWNRGEYIRTMRESPNCYFLHGSDYKCLLKKINPKLNCKDRLKGDNCRLVKEQK
jgi:hypothetical protein